jgi:hypothetical protein
MDSARMCINLHPGYNQLQCYREICNFVTKALLFDLASRVGSSAASVLKWKTCLRTKQNINSRIHTHTWLRSRSFASFCELLAKCNSLFLWPESWTCYMYMYACMYTYTHKDMYTCTCTRISAINLIHACGCICICELANDNLLLLFTVSFF